MLERTGTVVPSFHPQAKAQKYARELKAKKRYTDDGSRKVYQEGPNKGKQMDLEPTQAAYRSGYLQAMQDNSKVYKAKNK